MGSPRPRTGLFQAKCHQTLHNTNPLTVVHKNDTVHVQGAVVALDKVTDSISIVRSSVRICWQRDVVPLGKAVYHPCLYSLSESGSTCLVVRYIPLSSSNCQNMDVHISVMY